MSIHYQNHQDRGTSSDMARKQKPVSIAIDPRLHRTIQKHVETENARLESEAKAERITKNSVHETALRLYFQKHGVEIEE